MNKDDSENPSSSPQSESPQEGNGLAIDEILKAPVTPPKPKPGEGGPDLVGKIDKASHEASAQIGPKKPKTVNLLLVGLGIFILVLGIVGILFTELSFAPAILAAGFIAIAVGSFVKL